MYLEGRSWESLVSFIDFKAELSMAQSVIITQAGSGMSTPEVTKDNQAYYNQWCCLHPGTWYSDSSNPPINWCLWLAQMDLQWWLFTSSVEGFQRQLETFHTRREKPSLQIHLDNVCVQCRHSQTWHLFIV